MLLHGYLSQKESFYYQIKFLSKYYKVTAPDIIGFGASAALSEPYSLDDYCDWLEDYIKQSKIVCPHIIAHSFGARLTFKYLGERGGDVDKLIITGGAGLVKPRSKEYMRKVRAYRRIKKLFPKFAERHFGSAEYRTLSPVMRESYKKIVNEDLKASAAKIKNKTLLIYGESDTTTPPHEEGEIFSRLISGSELKIISGSHFCFSENYEKFNELTFEFLNG